MATPRKRRRKTTGTGSTAPRDQFRADIRDQLAALKRTKPDTDKNDDNGADRTDRPLTPREEYRAALDDFNSYSHNNETAEAIEARQRLDRADRNRRRLWKRSR